MIKAGRIERTKTVLVVDDQEINRDFLEAILEEQYAILFAENGQEALEVMTAHREELSVIMLDLMMPVMNGFEVLQRVREDEELQKIPIIVLTAEREAELRALQAGAADFITKPFDEIEVILARVGRIIEMSEGRKLISAAERDPLSGLYSRNFYLEYVSRLFRYHPELHLDAVVLNIEQFHSVNALHGREFGDEVLRVIGSEVRAFLAETEGIAGRMDGDRFGIFCRKQADYAQVLKRFQQKLNERFPDVNIHLRMGVCPWGENADPVTMTDRARSANSMVRRNYKNPLKIFDAEMQRRELLHQRLLNDLNRALEEKQITVFYQPKYDIQSTPPRLSSAEALVRWQHPELGMISPGVFVPLFEGNGLIGLIDNYVWAEAARQVARWREQFGFALPVSVNLSRSDMLDLHLEERLVRLIEENGLEYGDIKLEVTESAYTDNAQTVLDVIRRLRDIGFEIEMDDFGSGYSSLNMLSEMPIDVLKLDMKFISNIAVSETARRLVLLMLDIARYLRVRVVAEGVENGEQLQILRDSGCELVQGYYFSRPVPPQAFEELIRKELQTERTEGK